MKEIERIIQIAKRKYEYDKKNPWENGIESYLSGIEDEVNEVRQEIKNNDLCKLEKELGDILWDYINLLQIIENEKAIDIQKIFQTACKKYDLRMTGLENGKSWNLIKDEEKKKETSGGEE